MADTIKINELNEVTEISDNDYLVSDDGENTSKVTRANLLNVINDVTSTSTINPLSAAQGKMLNDRIDNLSNIGRFLSLWNCETGLPETNPPTLPYAYHTGDYYRVSVADEYSRLVPTGTSYTGIASGTAWTLNIQVGDIFYFDGTQWNLQKASAFTLAYHNMYMLLQNVSSVLPSGTIELYTNLILNTRNAYSSAMSLALHLYYAKAKNTGIMANGTISNLADETDPYFGIIYNLGIYDVTGLKINFIKIKPDGSISNSSISIDSGDVRTFRDYVDVIL